MHAESGHGVGRCLCDLLGDLLVQDAAFREFIALVFVLVVGFDQRDDACIRRVFQPSKCGGNNKTLWGPARINHDEIDATCNDYIARWRSMKAIGAFHDDDAFVVAEFPREDAVRRVNRVDLCSAVLKQAVRETTGAATEVGAGEALDVELEVGEGVLEFEAASGDVRRS